MHNLEHLQFTHAMAMFIKWKFGKSCHGIYCKMNKDFVGCNSSPRNYFNCIVADVQVSYVTRQSVAMWLDLKDRSQKFLWLYVSL